MAPKRSTTTVSAPYELSPRLRNDLAIALGYAVESGAICETAYIEDILGHWPGVGTLDEYVKLLVKIIKFFTSKFGRLRCDIGQVS
jgi:hypothetical protein